MFLGGGKVDVSLRTRGRGREGATATGIDIQREGMTLSVPPACPVAIHGTDAMSV